MTDDQRRRCHMIIHGSSGTAAAAAAGLAQIPAADAVLIMPIQVGMIIGLGRVFDIKVSKSAARSAAFAALGTIVGKGASKLFVRFIPGLGNFINASVAASVTETLGWTVVSQMEEGDFVN